MHLTRLLGWSLMPQIPASDRCQAVFIFPLPTPSKPLYALKLIICNSVMNAFIFSIHAKNAPIYGISQALDWMYMQTTGNI